MAAVTSLANQQYPSLRDLGPFLKGPEKFSGPELELKPWQNPQTLSLQSCSFQIALT